MPSTTKRIEILNTKPYESCGRFENFSVPELERIARSVKSQALDYEGNENDIIGYMVKGYVENESLYVDVEWVIPIDVVIEKSNVVKPLYIGCCIQWCSLELMNGTVTSTPALELESFTPGAKLSSNPKKEKVEG